MMAVVCKFCGEPLVYDESRGFVHQEGGIYLMVCFDCGYQAAPFPVPVKCPRCGSKNWGDHHAAFPVFVNGGGSG